VQTFDFSEMQELYIIFHQCGSDFGKVLGIKMHEDIDFFFWSFPVFDAEGVESEKFYSEVNAELSDIFDGFASLTMSFSSGQIFFLSPSAVTIHDYCDVSGHLLGCDTEALGCLFCFFFDSF